MCRWTLGTIERRCGGTVLVKPLTRKCFLIPEIATFFFFTQCTNKRNVEICRIARLQMCAYMSE